MNSNETNNNWIDKLKHHKLNSINNNNNNKPVNKRIKSTSLCYTSSSSSSRTSPSEFEFNFKNHNTTSPQHITSLNDYSSNFFINTNHTNTSVNNSNNLLIDTHKNDTSLNEFDLNNNDLAYTSICFDNIDLTGSTTTVTNTVTSTTSTNDKLDTNEEQNHLNSSLGFKFVNINHNSDLNQQRSNSVPVKNYDYMFSQSNSDLNNIDLNYSSLYFEAIDLCLPLTHNNNSNNNNNTTSHHSFDFNSTNHFDIPSYTNKSSYMTHSNDANVYLTVRSNSVPLNLPSDIEDTHQNIHTPKLESKSLHHHHLDEEVEEEVASHLNETNLINESVINQSESLINQSNTLISTDLQQQQIELPAINHVDITTSSESPIKSNKKSKSNKSNVNDLDQKSLENVDIKNDGYDLKPLIKDYFNMVYTCMIKMCGYECEKNDELVMHLKEAHQIELVTNDSISGKNGKLSYKCINVFDEKVCGKKLENLQRIVDHICKMHLTKIDYMPNNAHLLFSTKSSSSSSSSNNTIDLETQQQKEKLIVKLNQKPICFNNIFICSYHQCYWSFQFEEALKMHKLKHKFGLDLNDQINLEIIKQKSKPTERNYSCTACNSKFVRPSHLKNHLKSHENTVFQCDYCSEKFINISQLVTHVNENHKQNEKIFRCQYEGCMKAFYCKMYLTSHITKSHLKQENESEKICTECNIKFKQVWLKRQHDEIKHKKCQNLKTFKCTFEQCSKEFMTPSKLHRHNLTHLNAKSYKCNYENCNACFKRQYQLNSHLKSHQTDSFDNKVIYYKCDQTNCRSKFKSKEKLDAHKQNHLSKIVKNEDNDDDDDDLSDVDTNNECLILPVNLKEDSNDQLNEQDQHHHNQQQQSNQSIYALNNNTNFNNLKNFDEFKCLYCQFKFDTNDQLKLHLKSHIDINKANQKLNDYLIEISNHQKENIKYQEDSSATTTTSSHHLYHNSNSTNDQIKFLNEEQDEHHHDDENNYTYLNLIPDTDTIVLNDDDAKNKTSTDESDFTNLNLDHSDQANIINYFDENNNKNNNNNNQFVLNQLEEEEHVININSDDEEYATTTVVLENISGSARTDYKSNHIYIEKYRLKRKNNDHFYNANKKIKGEQDETYENIVKSASPSTTESPASAGSFDSALTPSPPLPQPLTIINQPIDTPSTRKTCLTSQPLNENLKRKLKLKSSPIV